jgi:hypothetical protein
VTMTKSRRTSRRHMSAPPDRLQSQQMK